MKDLPNAVEVVIDCHGDDEARRLVEWLQLHNFEIDRLAVRSKVNVVDSSAAYLRATNHDMPYQHMVCSKCKQPALMEYWEWSEIGEDKLQCPNCLALVAIGNWVDGVPAAKPRQKCLVCCGTGEVD